MKMRGEEAPEVLSVAMSMSTLAITAEIAIVLHVPVARLFLPFTHNQNLRTTCDHLFRP